MPPNEFKAKTQTSVCVNSEDRKQYSVIIIQLPCLALGYWYWDMTLVTPIIEPLSIMLLSSAPVPAKAGLSQLFFNSDRPLKVLLSRHPGAHLKAWYKAKIADWLDAQSHQVHLALNHDQSQIASRVGAFKAGSLLGSHLARAGQANTAQPHFVLYTYSMKSIFLLIRPTMHNNEWQLQMILFFSQDYKINKKEMPCSQ